MIACALLIIAAIFVIAAYFILHLIGFAAHIAENLIIYCVVGGFFILGGVFILIIGTNEWLIDFFGPQNSRLAGWATTPCLISVACMFVLPFFLDPRKRSRHAVHITTLGVGLIGGLSLFFYISNFTNPNVWTGRPYAGPLFLSPKGNFTNTEPVQSVTPSPIETSSPRGNNVQISPAAVVSDATPITQALRPGETYILMERVSITTDSGVSGIPQGTKVKVVRDAGKEVVVTDGNSEFSVERVKLGE